MIYRTLGRTRIRVSEIGMGCEGFVERLCQNAMQKVVFMV